MKPSKSVRARERLRGITSMVAAVFVFAIMDSLMKRLSSHYAPLQIACLRSVLSLLFLLPSIAWRRSWLELWPKNPPLHLFRALLGIIMLWSFVYAIRRLSIAQAYALYLTAPLLMTALSVPLLGESISTKRWLTIAAGLFGTLIILKPWGVVTFSYLAAAAAALATVCYSLTALTVRSLGASNSSMGMVFWYLTLVGLGSGALAIAGWKPVLPGDWIWLIGIGVSGGLGQLWLTDAFRRAPPSVVSPFEYTAILWAFIIDWLCWSVSPTLSLLIGAGIVVVSGVLVVIDEHRLGVDALSATAPP